METGIAHINIRGFVIKNVIDFDEVGGFRIQVTGGMVRYLSRDKIREMLVNELHKAGEIILDAVLNKVFENRDE